MPALLFTYFFYFYYRMDTVVRRIPAFLPSSVSILIIRKYTTLSRKMDGSAQQMQMCPLQWIPVLPHKLRKRYCRKLHLIPAAVILIPLFFPQVRTYLLTESDGRVMLLCTILVAAAYMGTGYLFAHMPNKIYSENSQINLQINALEKRLYTIFLFVSNILQYRRLSPGSSGILHPATGLAELEWASTFSSN